MPAATSNPAILSPKQFNQYAGQWVCVASVPNNPELEQYFIANAARILLVKFPIEHLIELVSAVGVRYINVRFMLIPSEGASEQRLALALCAVSAQHEQLSSYYLADAYETVAPALPTQNGAIPTSLAKIWLQQWQDLSQITSALFTTAKGVLQGYNFQVQDFVEPLKAYDSLEKLEVHLSFGASEYYAASNQEEPTQTAGLLLRVQGAQSGYYDMSAPYPPGSFV